MEKLVVRGVPFCHAGPTKKKLYEKLQVQIGGAIVSAYVNVAQIYEK